MDTSSDLIDLKISAVESRTDAKLAILLGRLDVLIERLATNEAAARQRDDANSYRLDATEAALREIRKELHADSQALRAAIKGSQRTVRRSVRKSWLATMCVLAAGAAAALYLWGGAPNVQAKLRELIVGERAMAQGEAEPAMTPGVTPLGAR